MIRQKLVRELPTILMVLPWMQLGRDLILSCLVRVLKVTMCSVAWTVWITIWISWLILQKPLDRKQSQWEDSCIRRYRLYQVSDFFRCVFDGSYFKIKQIQLGYSFPKQLIKKVAIENHVYMAHLRTSLLYRLSWFWPWSYRCRNSLGVDKGSYPNSKKVVLGLSVTFWFLWTY